MKDGDLVLLDEDNEGQSVLELASLTEADSGIYQCRATNEYSAITSTQALLNVKRRCFIGLILFMERDS